MNLFDILPWSIPILRVRQGQEGWHSRISVKNWIRLLENKTIRIMDKWDNISWTGLFTKQLDLGSRARGSTVTENGIKAKVKYGQAEVCNTLAL